MRLSVVICSYNRAESLRRVLEAMETQVTPAELAWEVLVVDNASTDHTRAVADAFVARRPDRFRALHEPKKGKSNALNLAIAEARGELLAFTDDDVEIASGWVAAVVRAFDDHDCAGIGGRIVPSFSFGRPDWMRDLSVRWIRGPLVQFELGDEPRRLEISPYGANMAFRKAVFARYGGFRTDLGPGAGAPNAGARVGGGAEDVELGGRLLRAGEILMYIPSAVLSHPVEPERLSKRYFEKWWYRHGRASMVEDDPPPDAVTYLGVPRYLLRVAGESAARWLLGLDRDKRLHARLELMEALGQIAEIRSKRRSRGKSSLRRQA